MAQNNQIDQDALAAEWGVALESESGAPTQTPEAVAQKGIDEAAAQWAAMVDDGELAPLYHEIEQAWVKKPFEVAESDKYAHGPVRAVAEILERHAE